MSYDIYLYEKQFLRHAQDEEFDDWDEAVPFPAGTLSLIRERLKARGYIMQTADEFEHPNSKWGLQVSLFEGEVSFAIPYWDDADAAIETARADALELANATELGFYDPQEGEAIT